MESESPKASNSAETSMCSQLAVCHSTTPECPICGDVLAENRRFGPKNTCKPCYSFFRRTVVENKTYKCKHNEKCGPNKGRNKHGCQYCRFQRCIRSGMTVDAMLNFRKDTFILTVGGNSTLLRVVHCNRSNFTTRFRATIDIYGGPNNYKNMAGSHKTVNSCKKASQAEVKVLSEYINRSGILSEEDRNSPFLKELMNAFLFTWLSAEIVYNTVKHVGFNHQRSYFVDDSYMIVDEDKILDFLRGFDHFYDPQGLADATMKMCMKVVAKARRMYELRISETEMAAVVLILLLKTAARLHPTPNDYKIHLAHLFRDLKKHYEEHFEDVAIRLGNVSEFVEMIEDVKASKEELAVLTAINEINISDGKGFERRLLET